MQWKLVTALPQSLGHVIALKYKLSPTVQRYVFLVSWGYPKASGGVLIRFKAWFKEQIAPSCMSVGPLEYW